MKKIFIQLSLLTIFILSVVVGCKKYDPSKLTATAWNPNLAVPLAYGHFTVYDIMARTDSNDVVIIDPQTGAIALVYRGEIVSYSGSDLVDMMDFSANVSLGDSDYGIGVAANYTGTSSASQNNQVNIAVNAGVEMYTVTLKNGMLDISVSTTLMHDVDVQVSIPSILENGLNPLSRTINLQYSGMVPQTGSVSIDLSNTLIDLTNSGTTFNEFTVQTSATISGTGQPVSGTESIDVQYDFTGLEFRNCTGYFGQQTIAVDNDSILLKIFNDEPDGYFELVDPKIRFNVYNELGFPAQINLANLMTIDASSGITFPLSGYPGQIQIPAPAIMGGASFTQLELNQTNTTNLVNVITPTPKWFYFEGSGISNPAGNVGANFLIDTSRLIIDAEVEMPLEGFAYGFTVSDTVDFTFSENVDFVESLMFRINVDNGFPVELETQVVILDSNYVPMFNLMPAAQNTVESAPVDANGRVTSSRIKITDIYLDESQIGRLGDARYIVILGEAQSLNGPSGQVVKIFDDYVIDLRVGMQVKGKFNL